MEKSGRGRGAFVVLLAPKEVPPHDVRKNILNGFKTMNAGGGRKHVSQPEIHDCVAFHRLMCSHPHWSKCFQDTKKFLGKRNIETFPTYESEKTKSILVRHHRFIAEKGRIKSNPCSHVFLSDSKTSSFPPVMCTFRKLGWFLFHLEVLPYS